MEYYLTDVCEQRDSPGIWGFEIFTKERLYLGHFNYCSEADASEAADGFVWVIEKLSSLSRASEV